MPDNNVQDGEMVSEKFVYKSMILNSKWIHAVELMCWLQQNFPTLAKYAG